MGNVEELQCLFKALYVSSTREKENAAANAATTSDVTINKKLETERNLLINKDTFLKLKHLNVSNSDLSHCPEEICYLKYLTVLNLSNNYLETLPNKIGNLCNLISLQLSGNKLSSLPKSLRFIHQLHYLDISHNKFIEVPSILCYSLRILKVLDISNNQISAFNAPPACLGGLVLLNLSNNNLKQLPPWIFHSLCSLKMLDVSGNQMCFDMELVNLFGLSVFESLQILNIENCNYSNASIQSLSLFKNLQTLRLGNRTFLNANIRGKNYFGNISANAFENLRCIKNLYLQNVQIATLPADLSHLRNINILDLSNNILSWLPDCFCDLTTLRILYLTSNQLLFLPNNIGNLSNLEQIHLGNNELYEIPESFYDLENLCFVDLYNNKIENIDETVFKKKNLKGIDLGLNCLDFSFSRKDLTVDEVKNQYNDLKTCFRKTFNVMDSRNDIQVTKSYRSSGTGYKSSGSVTSSPRYSNSSIDTEESSDVEDPSGGLNGENTQNCIAEEDWEQTSAGFEEDDLFDPNDVDVYHSHQNPWSLEYQKSYCPARSHTPALMYNYVKSMKLALSKEKAEEGQFDSD